MENVINSKWKSMGRVRLGRLQKRKNKSQQRAYPATCITKVIMGREKTQKQSNKQKRAERTNNKKKKKEQQKKNETFLNRNGKCKMKQANMQACGIGK